MAGINVVVAESEEEARRQFTVVEQMIIDLHQGRRRRSQPPVEPDSLEGQRALSRNMLQISAVGTPDQVKAQMEAFVERTGADELITVTYAFDPAARDRSLELLAKLWL